MILTLQIDDARLADVTQQLLNMDGVRILDVEVRTLPEGTSNVNEEDGRPDDEIRVQIRDAITEYVAVREGRSSARPLSDLLREL